MSSSVEPGRQRLEREREAIRSYEARRPREQGVLTPRERIDALIDPGSFLELGSLTRSQQSSADENVTPADGLVAGWATVHGREVALISEDSLVLGTTDAQVAGDKRLRILWTCAVRGVPLVYLADAQEGEWAEFAVDSGELFGHLGYQRPEPPSRELASPLVVVVFGRCVGRASELLAEADFVVSTPRGSVSVVPGTAMLDPASHGWPIDRMAHDDMAALASVRHFFELTPPSDDPQSPGPVGTPVEPWDDALLPHIGVDQLIAGIFDAEGVLAFEEREGFGSGVGLVAGHRVAFAATGGRTPHVLGTRDVSAIGRAARLSRRLRMPLILIQDTDGYDPHAASTPQFLQALARTTDEIRTTFAPKLVLVTGHGHVLGSFVMGGRQLVMDYVMALPFAKVAPRDVVAYHPGAIPDDLTDGPWIAAGFGHVDEVVAPSEARQQIVTFLKILSHGLDVTPLEVERHGRYVADIPKV